MSTVWSVHSGWRIDSVMGIGMGASVPIIEIGAGYDGINVTLVNMSTRKKVMYQGDGLGGSIGAGLNPFNMSAAGPAHETLNNYINTWPGSKLTKESFVGALYVFSANSEIMSATQNGQLWYFRGKSNYYPAPFGSVAAAVVAGQGASTEILAGSFSCMRYNLEYVKESE